MRHVLLRSQLVHCIVFAARERNVRKKGEQVQVECVGSFVVARAFLGRRPTFTRNGCSVGGPKKLGRSLARLALPTHVFVGQNELKDG
jgi:hypothetical protein